MIMNCLRILKVSQPFHKNKYIPSPIQPCRFFKRIAESGKSGRKPKQKKGDIVEANFKQSSLEHFQVRFREEVNVPLHKLSKPFGFACLVTAGSFAGAAIWQYEGMRSKAISKALEHYSDFFQSKKAGELRKQINHWFSNLSGTQKVILGIIAFNTAVFGLWRIPPLQLFMVKWFSANPAANAVCLPMFLSTFSHYSLWHLAVNMYVLWTFSYSMDRIFGKEQFLAMYLSAGVWSSFASHLLKVLTKRYNPSLGASGAIMAVLGSTCYQYPDARLAIVFLPFFTFSAAVALKALIGIESLGIIMRWGFFDHAAHLSGLLFGCYYTFDGYKHLWGNRQIIMETWHKYRGKPSEV